MKHTKGPWFVDKNYPSDVLAEKRAVLIQSDDIDINDPEIQANARLIAAAPDLLEALRAMIKVADQNLYSDEKAEVIGHAHDLILKATGGE